ncbi:DNA-binding protein [Mycetohabitans sp. B5]|uniref:Plasmid replication DNA-binding protein KfrA n=1 Tax=Mycetohabitans endofungorum TaxID=417203 RepID=A0A2P5K6I9_9BURK|nr:MULTISPECIES: DNA-binding protein [Mycetohabitans]MCG1054593.1 DNA-binding protein [Mycetohabitans sp. B5]PPB80369.1 plasmid replication DNA-binding protein KfrA [Mycetohabitans endofungorum]
MSDALPPDAALATEIARLKAAHPNTRELYREVCALLFFHFGITPTANRLYQLVRKGSMGTPTEVLAEFWRELREKSRVKLDHPDLPTELRDAAGTLIATLWERATATAHAALEDMRAEVRVERDAAAAEVAAAREAAAHAERMLETHHAALLAAQARLQELEPALAAAEAARQTLHTEVERLQRDAQERDAALAQARADFARELDKLRADTARAEARLQAAEKRALLETEHERRTSARLIKERDAAVRRADESDAQRRAERQALQAQLGDARQQIGVLEGSLAALQRVTADAEKARRVRQRTPTKTASGRATGPIGRPRPPTRALKKTP